MSDGLSRARNFVSSIELPTLLLDCDVSMRDARCAVAGYRLRGHLIQRAAGEDGI
jgi:hypothetical protein